MNSRGLANNQQKTQRWIEFMANEHSVRRTKYHPLPEGEGRGEGEQTGTNRLLHFFESVNFIFLFNA
jgi:hypothetical protein